MKAYLNKWEAVIDLHLRGFTEDFELFGNDLFWAQEKIFLRPQDFLFSECHRIIDVTGDELVVFAVSSPYFGVRGILLNHYKKYTDTIPAVVKKKLRSLFSSLSDKEDNHPDKIYSC